MNWDIGALSELASDIVGQPIEVTVWDLDPWRFLGSYTHSEQVIRLDVSLFSRSQADFCRTVWHEIGHALYGHGRQVSDDVAEREANDFENRMEASSHFSAPLLLVNRFKAYLVRERWAEIVTFARAQRSQPVAAPTRQTYTRSVFEAELRSGALQRDAQMQAGTIESMIARSLGLPNAEPVIERRVTMGGRVVAAG